MKKSLLLLGIISSLILIPGQSQAGQKCEISCNADYQKADKELNIAWKALSEIERNALRPSQRKWIKDRDRICGKDDSCLIQKTNQQTEYLKSVKSCTGNGGGLSCFSR